MKKPDLYYMVARLFYSYWIYAVQVQTEFVFLTIKFDTVIMKQTLMYCVWHTMTLLLLVRNRLLVPCSHQDSSNIVLFVYSTVEQQSDSVSMNKATYILYYCNSIPRSLRVRVMGKY
jgi:hypothetical protein